MEEKDLNAIVEKVGQEATAKFDSLKEELKQGFISEDAFKDQLGTFAEEYKLKELSDNVETLGVELKEMAEKQKKKEDEKPMSIKEQLAAGYDSLKTTLESNKKAKLSVKTNVTTGSLGSDSQGVHIPGFGQEATRGLAFEQYFPRFTLPNNHHGTVYYVDQTTTTRNAANTDEADSAPESALAWTQYSLGMGKILDSIPLTHEAMLDIDQLTAEVELFITNNIRIETDSNMWNGDGSLPNWKGIYTYATDFTQGIANGLDSIADASVYDLLLTVLTYISNGKENKYAPNVIFMNPSDILKAKMKKDSNYNYIIPPFVSRDGNQVAGAVIIPSAAITANTLAVGDARHVRYYDVEGIDLEFGLDGSDFSSDLITLKGRKRGNLLLRNVDATAFYKVTDVDQRVTDLTA